MPRDRFTYVTSRHVNLSKSKEKFLHQKRVELKSHRTDLGHQNDRRFLGLGTWTTIQGKIFSRQKRLCDILCLISCFSDPNEYDKNRVDAADATIPWPPFTTGSEKYLVLDLRMKIEERLLPDRVAFWNDFIPKLTEDEESVRKTAQTIEKDELWTRCVRTY